MKSDNGVAGVIGNAGTAPISQTFHMTATEAAALREAAAERAKDAATTSTVTAIGEHIALRPKPRPSVTKAGVFLPDEDNEPQQQYGTVLSIGSGVDLAQCPIKVGDEVVIGKYIEVQPDIGGHKVVILPWKAVLGKIERKG